MRRQAEVRAQKSEVRSDVPHSSDLRRLTSKPRRGFTLTELLIVMMILGIMTGLALSGLAGAINLAKEQRTRAIITKIDQLVMEHYEDYRTRSVPLNQFAAPSVTAHSQLDALRVLM